MDTNEKHHVFSRVQCRDFSTFSLYDPHHTQVGFPSFPALPDYLHVLPLLVLILILILDVKLKRDRSQLVLTFPPSPSTSSVMFPSHALVSLILSTR